MESWREEFYASDYGSTYLMHGRTYGSRNGISNTKGYKAIGRLAQKIQDVARRNKIQKKLSTGIESYELNISDLRFLADRKRQIDAEITRLKQNHADSKDVKKLEAESAAYAKALDQYSKEMVKASKAQYKAYVNSEAYRKDVKARQAAIDKEIKERKEAERKEKISNFTNALTSILKKEAKEYVDAGQNFVSAINSSKSERKEDSRLRKTGMARDIIK